MIIKKRLALTSLTIIALNFLSACGQDNSNKNVKYVHNLTNNRHALTIDTFSTFPPEIDGCSCYFSNDSTEFKKAVYIYMNDYSQTSFLKINNVLTKFTQTEFTEVDSTTSISKSKSDNYELIIEVKFFRQSGYETHLNIGTIKLIDKTGKKITKKFYGECGC